MCFGEVEDIWSVCYVEDFSRGVGRMFGGLCTCSVWCGEFSLKDVGGGVEFRICWMVSLRDFLLQSDTGPAPESTVDNLQKNPS